MIHSHSNTRSRMNVGLRLNRRQLLVRRRSIVFLYLRYRPFAFQCEVTTEGSRKASDRRPCNANSHWSAPQLYCRNDLESKLRPASLCLSAPRGVPKALRRCILSSPSRPRSWPIFFFLVCFSHNNGCNVWLVGWLSID